MADIKVGEEILDYVMEIRSVMAKLEEAYEQIQKIDKNICGGNTCYEGSAKDEIHRFFMSQSTHLQKLMGFYNKAAQYAFGYFTEMKFKDEEMTKMIISLFSNEKAG